jgi:hypothetical protein
VLYRGYDTPKYTSHVSKETLSNFISKCNDKISNK